MEVTNEEEIRHTLRSLRPKNGALDAILEYLLVHDPERLARKIRAAAGKRFVLIL